MMHVAAENFITLLQGLIQDAKHAELRQKMNDAYTQYVYAEAECRKCKADQIIKAMFKLDCTIQNLTTELECLQDDLTEEGRNSVQQIITGLQKRRNELCREKKRLKKI